MNTEETTDLALSPEEIPSGPTDTEPHADQVAADAKAALSGEEILQRMETIRLRIDVHADEVAAQVSALRDWRSYVRSYPWLSVSAAAAIGFVIVPSRKNTRSEDSSQRPSEQTGSAAAEELKSVLVGAAKKAATAYARKSLGAFVSGFVESAERT